MGKQSRARVVDRCLGDLVGGGVVVRRQGRPRAHAPPAHRRRCLAGDRGHHQAAPTGRDARRPRRAGLVRTTVQPRRRDVAPRAPRAPPARGRTVVALLEGVERCGGGGLPRLRPGMAVGGARVGGGDRPLARGRGGRGARCAPSVRVSAPSVAVGDGSCGSSLRRATAAHPRRGGPCLGPTSPVRVRRRACCGRRSRSPGERPSHRRPGGGCRGRPALPTSPNPRAGTRRDTRGHHRPP